MRITAGIYKGRVLKTGSGEGYRPTSSKVREALFSMLASYGVQWANCRVLDLFAGSGSLGFEAFSRGALNVTFVESSPPAAALLLHNSKAMGMDTERIRVIREDASRMLTRAPQLPFDVIFLDPPYQSRLLPSVLRNLMAHDWLAENGIICAEMENRIRKTGKAAFSLTDVTSALTLVTERNYRQTRVCIWTRKNE